MLVTIPITNDVTLVFTRDNFGFQAILDMLPQASWVDVVTFNLSAGNEHLLKLLRNLAPNVAIRVVTNLPKRRRFYRWQNDKKSFKNMLTDYQKYLDPKLYKSEVAGFFNLKVAQLSVEDGEGRRREDDRGHAPTPGMGEHRLGRGQHMTAGGISRTRLARKRKKAIVVLLRRTLDAPFSRLSPE